ncbi:MAG: GNAT family N-acetyltransferase [Oscillospiraceae bacterium]|nr:GNAT family N-acetyltransferase [Oscillospiraceae bacterium]
MILIKQALITQYDQVEEFYRNLIDSMQGVKHFPKWKMGIYPTEEQLKNAISAGTLYLSYYEDKIVGAMILDNNFSPEYSGAKWQITAEKHEIMIIHVLAVSTEFQGKGIAKKMVGFAIDLCKNRKMKAIRLDVMKENIPAAKLYIKAGFTLISTVEMYYEDTGRAVFDLYEIVL